MGDSPFVFAASGRGQRFRNFHHAGEHGGNFRPDRVSEICDPKNKLAGGGGGQYALYGRYGDQPLDRDQFGDG